MSDGSSLLRFYRQKKKELKCRIYSHEFAYREWLQEKDMSRYECIRCGREEKV